jgi:osmoprotectant transport system ATP-binding protein
LLNLKNISKSFNGTIAVANLSFRVQKGETLCLIGQSGCGKSTTLKMINRLLEPDSGSIIIDGKDISTKDPVKLRREIGYVSQEGGLFPHWTVQKNIGLVPRLEGWSPEKIKKRIPELLKLVDMEPDKYLDRFPAELSGGQLQRISIARALGSDPELMLMDEPFSSLDPLTRRELQEEFLSLKKELNKTIVFVSHDIREAFLIADHILMMHEGKILQYGKKTDFLNTPANSYVESFIKSQLYEI